MHNISSSHCLPHIVNSMVVACSWCKYTASTALLKRVFCLPTPDQPPWQSQIDKLMYVVHCKYTCTCIHVALCKQGPQTLEMAMGHLLHLCMYTVILDKIAGSYIGVS